MERRRALALAAAGALVGAASLVAASAGLLQAPEPPGETSGPTSTQAVAAGPSLAAGPLDPVVVTERRDVYDTVTVRSGSPLPSGDGSGAAPGAAPAKDSSPSVTVTDGSEAGGTTTTAPSVSPTTTTVPSPTTTLPPGVPSDWPAGKPIPPMPEGCQKPQLEDNGVWNCDH